MGKYRKRLPVGSRAFKRIRMLPCLPELRAKVVTGVAATEIARWLQDEMGHHTDMNVYHLAAEVQGYRRNLASMELIEVRQPEIFEQAKKEIHDGLDELKELDEMFQMQKERIQGARDMEKELGGLLNARITNEMRVATEILRASHNIKMDLTGGRELGTLTVQPHALKDVKGRYGEKVDGVMQDPQKRERVLGLFGKLMTAVQALPEDEDDVIEGDPKAVVAQSS